MHNGFFRAAACSPKVAVADVETNVDRILTSINRATKDSADMVVFPELSLTGYTCADLLHNSMLLQSVETGLLRLTKECPENIGLVIVGAPIIVGGQLYNCGVALSKGKIHGIVPKTYLPEYNEFYEKRWFRTTSSKHIEYIKPGFIQEDIPFSNNTVFEVNGVNVGMELCEDLWSPIPPSTRLAMGGAQIIANLSASNELVGKNNYLRHLIEQQSARCLCAYVYASAGVGESSTDLVFAGKASICENGKMLQEDNEYAVADIDIEAINHDRMHISTFSECAKREDASVNVIKANCTKPNDSSTLLRNINPRPFAPADSARMAQMCEEVLFIQSRGLMQRLEATKCTKLVVGISGGLDSTLALLVAHKAFTEMELDTKGIIGITMPGFGTTDRTYNNALSLMQELGISVREISIAKAVEQHFSDIGHDKANHDVTYENSQARERTQILMDVANQVGGMVLGTGDLSELALGWATYNGDHMSMYGVNAGVPKTLVRHLVRHIASDMPECATRTVLEDILDTPISPELIPADESGNITQKTEDLVGPYELHDFFLYYMIRYGFSPKRIYLLAQKAFEGKFDNETIKKWLRTFMRRFFNQQFKRSCMPDGPKVGSVNLSPRGDWRMPSDAISRMWLDECDNLY